MHCIVKTGVLQMRCNFNSQNERWGKIFIIKAAPFGRPLKKPKKKLNLMAPDDGRSRQTRQQDFLFFHSVLIFICDYSYNTEVFVSNSGQQLIIQVFWKCFFNLGPLTQFCRKHRTSWFFFLKFMFKSISFHGLIFYYN